MIAKISSSAIMGIDAYPVEVEVDISSGMPRFDIVGLPDVAVNEAKERVRAAINNSGYAFPLKKITVNLAPADTKKMGPLFDLPIAVGILAASGQVPTEEMEGIRMMGELSLDGTIRGISGVLPMAHRACVDKINGIVVPCENRAEASHEDGISIFPYHTLQEVGTAFDGFTKRMPYKRNGDAEHVEEKYDIDFYEVRGQESAKRALEVAAAGNHNLLMIGAPGSGKSMLAKRLPTILPDMNRDEKIEVTKIHSIMGLVRDGLGLIRRRPYRSPHHTISPAGLAGGGSFPTPGEVSLAHHGVLFLDELPEFKGAVLEVMRQPLEDGRVTIARAAQTLTFPANFMLVAAMNPCPCGYYGDLIKECSCSPSKIKQYVQRISGPLLDRIDIHINVPRVEYQKLKHAKEGDESEVIRKRVNDARKRQNERFQGTGIHSNSQMREREIRKYCRIPDEAQSLLKHAVDSLGMSARAYNRIFKIALTIADLEGVDEIKTAHIAEAIHYRSLDRDVV